MPGLVEHHFDAPGQDKRGGDPPACGLGLASNLYPLAAQLLDGGVEVVAHEGQLMTRTTIERRPLGWMNAEL